MLARKGIQGRRVAREAVAYRNGNPQHCLSLSIFFLPCFGGARFFPFCSAFCSPACWFRDRFSFLLFFTPAFLRLDDSEIHTIRMHPSRPQTDRNTTNTQPRRYTKREGKRRKRIKKTCSIAFFPPEGWVSIFFPRSIFLFYSSQWHSMHRDEGKARMERRGQE